MSRIIPFATIPDSTIFPDGIYRLKVVKVEETMTKEREGKVQKLMYRAQSQVIEPAAYKGLFYFENYVIGTDDDPEAEQLETWQTSIGGRSLKRFSKALGIPLGDEEDSEGFCNTVKGQEYLATVVQKTEEKEGPYKGTIRNNTTAYWKLGEKEPALTNGAIKTATPRATTTKTAAAKPADKVPPSDELTCTGCKARVPRAQMKAHVEQHMREFQAAQDGAE
jgi:hypothetical protein